MVLVKALDSARKDSNRIEALCHWKESRRLRKPPTANTEVSPIKTQVAITVKWPSNTHRPSFSIIPIASRTTAQAGMEFEKGIGNGNINPKLAMTMPRPINMDAHNAQWLAMRKK
jgi:hypothetical protein